ncbi:Serine/threonine-protein kinase smg1 [Ancistrocladus abbreviatus]
MHSVYSLNYTVEWKDTWTSSFCCSIVAVAGLSSHREHGICKQLEGLLMMPAKLSPWFIAYPTLVDVNSSNKEPAKEIQNILGFFVIQMYFVIYSTIRYL